MEEQIVDDVCLTSSRSFPVFHDLTHGLVCIHAHPPVLYSVKTHGSVGWVRESAVY